MASSPEKLEDLKVGKQTKGSLVELVTKKNAIGIKVALAGNAKIGSNRLGRTVMGKTGLSEAVFL